MSKESMIFRTCKFGLLTALLAWSGIAGAAPGKPTNQPPRDVQSIFLIPNEPKEGRDPFFPTATSLYHSPTPGPVTPPSNGVELLKLVGFFGTSFANINGVTFAVGETEEVKTVAGPVSVRLLQIKAQDEAVVIEANGQRRELKHSGGGGLTGKP
jgi:hypothetical protein